MRRLSVAMLAVGAGLLAASALGSPRQTAPADTFRLSYSGDIDHVDPAFAHEAPSWALEYATGAMLFNYPDAPAPRGARLIPEVAAGFPRISPDGRTYTFRLKRTYRFSNGRRVRAVHFVHAFRRALSWRHPTPAAPFLSDVVDYRTLGADGLRIRLRRPAGDILARLAMPFFMAVPTNTPVVRDGIDTPVASAGPYFIREWTRNRRIILVRNRFYRGPRPHRVERIVVDVGLPLETIKLNIDRGVTDTGDIPPSAHAELGRRYGVKRRSPGRYFANPAASLVYLAMNHERRLFGGPTARGNVRLKRAVNYAIDRRALALQWGAFAVSVQSGLLPPTARGYRPVPLYPDRPNLQRARALARGQLRGGKGNFYCRNGAPFPQMCQIVQANVRELGLDLDIKLFPRCSGCDEGDRIRGAEFDAVLRGWTAPYFDPYAFLFIVDGTTIKRSENDNVSYLNEPATNRKIARARALIGAARYTAFAEVATEVMREIAPLAVVGTNNSRAYVSDRTGCYHHHPVYRFDFPAICVRG